MRVAQGLCRSLFGTPGQRIAGRALGRLEITSGPPRVRSEVCFPDVAEIQTRSKDGKPKRFDTRNLGRSRITQRAHRYGRKGIGEKVELSRRGATMSGGVGGGIGHARLSMPFRIFVQKRLMRR